MKVERPVSRVFHFSTSGVWAQTILCCGELSCAYGMFSNFLGFYLDHSSLSFLSQQSKLSPDITKRPLGGKNWPLDREITDPCSILQGNFREHGKIQN